MTTLDSKLKTSNKTSFHPFEETFKTSYSHGLEQIYAIEMIDLSKVKRIEEPLPETSVGSQKGVFEPFFLSDQQDQMELGDEYRGWIEPLFLDEPIQVLGLSQRAESSLLDHGKLRLRQLINLNSKTFGIGQGHIDEIHKKLTGYIRDRSQNRSYVIEFRSLILSLMVEADRKGAALLLEPFHLDFWVPLSPAEKMTLFNLKSDERSEWSKEAKNEWWRGGRKERALALLTRLAHVFLIPWIRGRGGVVTRGEIEERVERVSEEPSLAKQALQFLSWLYFEERFPFHGIFYEVEEGLYCPDQFTAAAFHEICKRAESYFYHHPQVHYSLEELIRKLHREFGREWRAYADPLMTLALRRSTLFHVGKGNSGGLEVRLA